MATITLLETQEMQRIPVIPLRMQEQQIQNVQNCDFAICGAPSLDATREGILAALKDAGIVEGENLKVDLENAQADQANNLSIAQKIAADSNDLVLAIATPSAQSIVQALSKASKDTPILFAAVTDPLDAKIVTDLEHPGGNVSGVSDTNPEAINRLMQFIATQFPNVKKLGIVINEGEPNAVIMAEIAKKSWISMESS